MTRISDRTVLFADLRGSTALFETLGNAEATSVVTHCVNALSGPVTAHNGSVVKTLGDGLMAVFDAPAMAVPAAMEMHDLLDGMVSRGKERGASSGLRGLKLQVALARGEVVEMAGDCYGDAVNVAARLLDHAGDNETLLTVEVLGGLSADLRSRFRSLDRLVLRGRVEPVEVHVMGGRRGGIDLAATQFGDVSSYNGTYVRINDGEIVSLRRGSCTLHGSGTIGLGGSPSDPGSACVSFDVLRFADTQPQVPLELR